MDMATQATVKTLSRPDVDHYKFQWKIENFTLQCRRRYTTIKDPGKVPIQNRELEPSRSALSNTSVTSVPFTKQDTTWQVKLIKSEYSDYYDVKLILLSAPPRWVTYKVSFVKPVRPKYVPVQRGPKISVEVCDIIIVGSKESINSEYVHPNHEFGFTNFISDKDVNPFLDQEDSLTIDCKITAMTDQKLITVPKSDVISKLKYILDEEKFSDFTLEVATEEFKVHRAILSTHSDVFTKMFECEMQEAKKLKARIEGIEPEIVKEMLTYIYTGEAPNIKQDQMAKQLLIAANRYQLERLKVMCEAALSETLTINNAAELLTLATSHQAKQLKAVCLNLISSNWRGFMRTAGWQEIKKDTELAAELMEEIAKLDECDPPQCKPKVEYVAVMSECVETTTSYTGPSPTERKEHKAYSYYGHY